MSLTVSKEQARRFMLLKQGLLGECKYIGKQGVLDFVNQAGCVQFDPVDVCGQSADIVLHSRVKDYSKEMLDELLYKDRLLVDYFDKNLCIFPVEYLPVFWHIKPGGGYAEAYHRRGGEAVEKIEPLIRRLIAEKGHISASEIKIDDDAGWNRRMSSSLPRVALESMYFRGELIIHHKTGKNKSYAFAKDHIPEAILSAALPFKSEDERFAWHVLRRIGAVGLLWNKASDAWLGLSMKSAQRQRAFELLQSKGKIKELHIESLKDTFYFKTEDEPLFELASSACAEERCEFIAPLDSLMWDRKLIKALFDFDYSWEIYTPAEKRKYGAYVLPILYGENFIGRIEAASDRRTKTFVVKNIWYEDGVKQSKALKAAIENCVERFARFNDCIDIS